MFAKFLATTLVFACILPGAGSGAWGGRAYAQAGGESPAPAAGAAEREDKRGGAAVLGGEATLSGVDPRTPGEIARAYVEASGIMDVKALKSLHTPQAREGLDAMERNLEEQWGIDLSGNEPMRNETNHGSRSAIDADGRPHFYTTVPLLGYEIGEATVEGNSAIVPMVSHLGGEKHELTLRMRREAEGWRIYATDLAFGEMSISTDFEKLGSHPDLLSGIFSPAEDTALGAALNQLSADLTAEREAGGSEKEIASARASFDAVRTMTEADYLPSWRNEAALDSVSVGEALKQLVASLGLEIIVAGHESRLEVPVEASLAGLSNLEAIEKLCAQVGVHPEYPYLPSDLPFGESEAMREYQEKLEEASNDADAGIEIKGFGAGMDEVMASFRAEHMAIKLVEGARAFPVAFAGPFMIEVESVKEKVPHGSGRVQIEVRAFNVDPGLLHLLEGERVEGRITDVDDEHGRSLLVRPGGETGIAEVVDRKFNGTYFVELKNLLRDVTRIDVIRGKQRVLLPTKIEEFEFDSIETAQEKRVGPYTVTIEPGREFTDFCVTGPRDSLAGVHLLIAADDEAGNPMGKRYEHSGAGGDAGPHVSVEFPGKPARIHAKLITESRILEYPFEFGPLPLKHSAEMPEVIAELDFGAEARPLSVVYRSHGKGAFGQEMLTAEATNHSNKDVASAMADVIYRGKNGEPLGESFVSFDVMPPMPEISDGDLSMEELMKADLAELQVAVLIKAGETLELRTLMLESPEGVVGADFTVTHVRFADGTEWSDFDPPAPAAP